MRSTPLPSPMFDPERVWLGIAPTGWTNDDLPSLGGETSFEQCVSEMALAGFAGCGLGHKAPEDPALLKAALDLRGLRVSGLWFGSWFTVEAMYEQTLERFREVAALLQAVGATDVVMAEMGHAVHLSPVAVLPNSPHFDDRAWRALVDGLHALGREAVERGLRISYHPHVGTGVERAAEIDRLMEDTDPALVTLLFDSGHLAYAGEDPVEIVRRHGDRISHVHLKDVRRPVLEAARERGSSFLQSVLDGVFTIPGQGDVDFPAVLRALAGVGFEGWMVVEAEQDPAVAIPLEQAKLARAYLRSITGL